MEIMTEPYRIWRCSTPLQLQISLLSSWILFSVFKSHHLALYFSLKTSHVSCPQRFLSNVQIIIIWNSLVPTISLALFFYFFSIPTTLYFSPNLHAEKSSPILLFELGFLLFRTEKPFPISFHQLHCLPLSQRSLSQPPPWQGGGILCHMSQHATHLEIVPHSKWKMPNSLLGCPSKVTRKTKK